MDALEDQPIQSILAIDCGTLYTRALLVDIVADEYRFVGSGSAPTTAELPFADITVGVYQAIADLEATTGRRLVDDGRVVTPQHVDGHGVDVVVATCSAAPALRLIVAGIAQEHSTRAARNAASSTYADVLDTISIDAPVPETPDGPRARPAGSPTWTSTQVEKLLTLSPDAVLVAGGVDSGPISPLLRIAEVIVRAAAAQRRREEDAALVGGQVAPPPLLFFAGNPAALDPIQHALGDAANLVALPNMQPRLGVLQPGPVREALSGLYRQKQLPQLAGLDSLRRWTGHEIEPTLHAVELVTRYISVEYRRDVLTADVGAANTAVILAGGKQDEEYGVLVRSNHGLAQGLSNLLGAVGPAAVLRWLPFEYSAEDLQDWAMNRVIRPLGVAQTTRDLAIEHAFAREALRAALADLRAGWGLAAGAYDLLVGTGGLLASAPRVGQAALILLDALEPTGETVGSLEIALDTTQMVAALGAIAQVHPGAAASLFDRDCLVLLGTCVVPLGSPAVSAAPARNGRAPAQAPEKAGAAVAPAVPVAVQVTVEYAEAGSFTVEVPYGSIEVVPLRPEQRASLRVKPGPGFHIGRDEPGKEVQTKPGEEIKGGQIGLIIDARGRPLVLPENPEARIARLLEWGRALHAYSARESFGAGPVAAGGAGDTAFGEVGGLDAARPPVAARPAPAPPPAPPAAPVVMDGTPQAWTGASAFSLAPEPPPAPPEALLPRWSTSPAPAAEPDLLPATPEPPPPDEAAEPPPWAPPGSVAQRLNLPSLGPAPPPRKGTAPLSWPKQGEE